METVLRQPLPSRPDRFNDGSSPLQPGESGIMIVLQAVALYAVAGIAIAASFLAFGVTSVLPTRSTVTLGARIVLFPGAVALWPCVLIRWLKSFR